MTSAWRWMSAAAVLAVVIALLPTLHSGSGATYASSTPLLALEALAGIALVATVAAVRVTDRQAILLFVGGGTWLVPELAGIAAIGLHVRTLSDAWTHLLPVLLVLTVVRETPEPRRWASRVLLTTGVLAGGVAAAARIFLVDPSSTQTAGAPARTTRSLSSVLRGGERSPTRRWWSSAP